MVVLDMPRRSREQGRPWNAATCFAAAEGGHLAVLRWARQHGCPWDKNTCYAAAIGGHLVMLRWARGAGLPMGRGHLQRGPGWRASSGVEVGRKAGMRLGCRAVHPDGRNLCV